MMHALFWSALMLIGNPIATGPDPKKARILFAFDDPAQAREWQAVNDRVMGGVSEGRFRITKAGTLEFSGTLSLENNGGFASIRSLPRPLGLRPGDVFRVRLRGDGRRYLLNLYVPDSRTAFSYRAAIQTVPDEWVEVPIPLESFRASWFGRQVDDPLEVERVHSLGFMVSDGKPGPFRLEIDSVQIVGSGSKD